MVETAISVFFTGGTLSLGRVLRETFIAPAQALMKGLSGVLRGLRGMLEKVLGLIQYMLKQLRNPKKLFADLLDFLDEVFGVAKDGSKLRAKKVVEFREFAKKWQSKSISLLTREEMIANLRGFTKQGNKVADAIENSTIKIKILNSKQYRKMYAKTNNGSLKGIDKANAFTYDEVMYFKKETSVERFMAELIHEGTHATDWVDYFIGNNWSWEKRAFFWERQFQIAAGLKPEFATIEEMISFIKTEYTKY